MNNTRLTRIELFAFHTRPSFLHSPGPSGCWYGILKLTCGGQISYGECILCADDNAVDLVKWGSYLRHIRSCTAQEAFGLLQLHGQEWAPNQRALLLSALAGLRQTGRLRAEITAGSTRAQNAAAAYESAEFALDPSLLFDEAVSYYSLL